MDSEKMIYQSERIKVSKNEQGIAKLTFTSKDSANILDIKTIFNLEKALDNLKEQEDVQALVVTSDKENFILGADITEFLDVFSKPEQEISNWLHHANDIFNKLENLPFVTISAVSGYALGGGCECILATDYRIAATNARIGLPETKLGIIPGFGGTVRLPRLIGADNAIEMICSGKEQKAEQCLKLGLVDAVVSEEKLNEKAIDFAKEAIEHLDWKTKRAEKQKPLKLSAIEAKMVFATSKGFINQMAGEHYPAPIMAISSIENGAKHSRDEALSIENEDFVKLAKNDVTKALVGIFLNSQLVKSKTKKAIKEAQKTTSVSVLGAGIMGGGIAYQSASKGVPVLMKDIEQKALDTGMHEASKLLNQQFEQGRINSEKISNIMAAITPSLHYAGIEQANIVIEAVVENPKIKAAVLSEAEQKISANTILATNTSTIPISTLAKSLTRPEKFCGMHFFNPVHRMPLVEVIKAKKTSKETINSVVAYAAQIGKTPIVVKDCPGFFVNRVLFPYFVAFSNIIRDGANFTFVDKVMEKNFGFPMGPAYLLDVIGIDTAHHAQSVMAKGYPERMSKIQTDIIDLLYKAERFGQKNGAGFYRYEINKKGKPKKLRDTKVVPLIQKVSLTQAKFTQQEIINRMLAPMINEVVRCLDEQIIETPAEADMALVYGLGFPPFRGGIFRYLDTIGTKKYVSMAKKFEPLGAAYEIPASLKNKAKQNQGYFDEQIDSGENA